MTKPFSSCLEQCRTLRSGDSFSIIYEYKNCVVIFDCDSVFGLCGEMSHDSLAYFNLISFLSAFDVSSYY